MLDCCVYLFLLVVFMEFLVKTKEVIVGVIMKEVDLRLKILSTLTLTIMDKLSMMMGEVKREVYIGIIPTTFLHITMM